MMHSKEELVLYRIERAKEAYLDAAFLISEERWNAAANRMYYACFYIVSAYTAFRSLSAVTHSGLKSAFNLELVKTGKISREDGILYNRLFTIRQQGDYEDFINIQEVDILPLVPKLKALIQEIENIIEEERSH